MKYTRRKFIKTVGIGSGLVLFSPISSVANHLFTSDKKYGIALVGLGNYSTNQLAPALLETKHCFLNGIVTGTPSKIEIWRSNYNIPPENVYNYDNFDNIVNNKSIDIVYVVLPNSMHHEFVIRAAKAGKHVFCEKPMALSVKECSEMIDACNSAGVRLFIGYRLHFDPFNQAAMNFRNEGVGKINVVESEFGFRIGNPNQWRLKKALAGGGALMDVGIYAVQAARYSTGKEPLTVTAKETKSDPEKFKEVDDTIEWQMEFPGGTVSKSATSYSDYYNSLHIEAENGWLELKPAFSYGSLEGRTHKGPLKLKNINQQAAQMDNFSKCIMEGCKSDADGEEGLKDLKVIEAIYRAVKSGEKEKV